MNQTPSATPAGAGAPSAERDNGRRNEQGTVVSAKMTKTIVVEVEQSRRHPRYEKILRHHVRRFVHDENAQAKLGDLVEIQSTRRLSKNKRWRLLRVVRAADPKSQIAIPGLTN